MTNEYSARRLYRDPEGIESYERRRFSGLLGRFRRARERRAVEWALAAIPQGAVVLDCPCGTGRWWPVLAAKASRVVAVDLSPEMRAAAAARAETLDLDVAVVEGEAEKLPLEDDAVDYTFSFALTKHLPVPVQYEVLREFARVSRSGVIATFGVLGHLTYEIWRRRKLDESYPVLPEDLERMARFAGLEVVGRRRCTTPVGVEHVVLFRRLQAGS